jgi:alanyl-tRNA synthetase
MSKDYDPRMHTAEHILNQTMVRMFQTGRAFSSHIEKKKSKCDYHFTRNLTDEEIAKLEKNVDDVIKADMPVTAEFLARSEAEKIFNLGRLPDDAGDPLRIIKVGDYDACPCIGPHVSTSGEVGGFKVISSSFENDVLRLRFKLTEIV